MMSIISRRDSDPVARTLPADRIILRALVGTFAAIGRHPSRTQTKIRTLRGHIEIFADISVPVHGVDLISPLIINLIMSELTPPLPPITDVPSPAPKKRGPKPGTPKQPGSGRKPGGKNKVPADLRGMILARGKPLELLCDISRGVKIRVGPQAGPAAPEYVYPTLQERAAAARILIDKIIPAAHELTGKDGAPLNPPQPTSDMELAHLLTFFAKKEASRQVEERDATVAKRAVERVEADRAAEASARHSEAIAAQVVHPRASQWATHSDERRSDNAPPRLSNVTPLPTVRRTREHG